jgi:hypothetical protein
MLTSSIHCLSCPLVLSYTRYALSLSISITQNSLIRLAALHLTIARNVTTLVQFSVDARVCCNPVSLALDYVYLTTRVTLRHYTAKLHLSYSRNSPLRRHGTYLHCHSTSRLQEGHNKS